MTRVLLDLTPLVTTAVLRGIGRYIRGLVQGLAELGPEGHQGLEIMGLCANDAVTRLLPPTDRLGEYVERDAPQLRKYCGIQRSALITFRAPSAARLAKADVLHLTEPRGTPSSENPVITLTAHDLIVLLNPKLYLPPIPGWTGLYRALDRRRYFCAKRIIAISHATKRDLVEELGFDASQIEVVYHGVNHQRFCPVGTPEEAERIATLIGSNAPYVVYIGAGDARKDLDTLVAAHVPLAKQGTLLVLAGHLNETRRAGLEQLAKQIGIRDAVRFAGYVPDDLIPALYRRAALHVFPSRYEGFGLPILEALACGTPTITSPGSALDEVAGDAAEVVPCGEPERLAATMERVLTDTEYREAMVRRGIARASGFTWRRCAEDTVAFWARTSRGPSSRSRVELEERRRKRDDLLS